jgi:signal transduction histidine kinase
MLSFWRSRRLWLALVLVTGAAALALALARLLVPVLDPDPPGRWNLVPESEDRGSDVFPADVDGDGIFEVLVLEPTRLLVNSHDGVSLAQLNFPRHEFGRILHAEDVNGNGLAEVFIHHQYADRAVLDCWWDHRGRAETVRVVEGEDVNADGRIDATFGLRHVADLDSDGTPEGLVNLARGIDWTEAGRSRHIEAITLIPGFRGLWLREFGPSASAAAVADIDGDGTLEIPVYNHAVGNGIVAGETSDKRSYDIVLDAKGRIERLEERGGPNSSVDPFLADLDGDGDLELLRLVIHRDAEDPFGQGLRIEVVDPRSYEILHERRFPFPGSCLVLDADADGRDEIYISQHREVYRLDRNLEIPYHRRESGPVLLRASIDLTSEDRQELVGIVGENALLVLSPRLEPVLERPGFTSSSVCLVTPREGTRGPSILAVDHRGQEAFWVRYRFEESEGRPGIASLPVELWLLGGSWLVALALLLFWSRTDSRPPAAAESWDLVEPLPFLVALVGARGSLLRLNAFGADWSGGDSTPGAPLATWLPGETRAPVRDQLARFLRNGPAEHREVLRPSGPTGEELWELHLSRPGEAGRETLVMLRDRTMEAKSQQALEWAALAQDMIHNRVKNPLGTILLAVRRMEQDLERRPDEWVQRNRGLLETVAGEVVRMDESCRTFLRFTRLREANFEEVDPSRSLARVEARLRPAFREGERLEVKLGEDLPTLRADSEQLEWMLENLVVNARQSLRDGGGLVGLGAYERETISGEGSETGFSRAVVFEVSDTGVGVPDEERDRIFQPFVTSRPGGSGLGLAIVRQIVEIHGGQIELESTPGLGTRFIVTLPAGES